MMSTPPALVSAASGSPTRMSSNRPAPRLMPPWMTSTESAASATPGPSAAASAIDAKPSSSDFVVSSSMSPRRPSLIEPRTVSGPTQNSSDAVKNASLTRRVAAVRAREPRLEPVAERLQPVLDPQQLAGDAAEQDGEHDDEDQPLGLLAPGQRVVDAEDERHEPEAGEHALVHALGQAAAGERADERARARIAATLMSVPVTSRAG